MLNIVIPMAGRGSRLKSHDPLPKPLVELWPGKRVVQMVLDYLRPAQPHRFIFVCQKRHLDRLDLLSFFQSLDRPFEVVVTERITQGPACTALLAEALIDNRDELLIAYCDDYLDIDIDDTLRRFREKHSDGGLLLYRSTSRHNSYARTDGQGTVVHTAEKERVSPWATAGLYYFKEGRRFVEAAHAMIRKNRRARNEFFVCPVFNEMIAAGQKVSAVRFSSAANFPMGTPSELERLREAFGPKKGASRQTAAAKPRFWRDKFRLILPVPQGLFSR